MSNSNTSVLRNIECERYILWAFRLDWNRYLDSWIQPSDFSDAINERLFQMMIDAKWNEVVVMWRVMELSQDFINAFAETSFVSWFIDEQKYQEALEEVLYKSKLRKRKALAKSIYDWLEDWKDNEFIMSKVNQFFDLEEIKEENSTEKIQQQIVDEALHQVRIKRFLTWYKELDSILWWFVPNQLITVGARPWRWKSMFATSTLINQLKLWFRVAFFSLEMSEKEIQQRMYSNLWELELNYIKWTYEWDLTTEQTKKLNKALVDYNKIKDRLFMFDNLYSLSMIANKIRLLWMREAVDIIYIDYLWLIECKAETKNLEISKITRTLKILAMKYKIPIVILAQLNRWVDEEDQPYLNNLRDSWSIEQDSDVVLMLQRPDNEDMKVYVRKNRNWPTGEVQLATFPQFMQLGNYEKPF